ncbi:metallophosphoesterase [Actinoplanes flavus]|uniref:Metallophosphoesterase n=1 Tax=Actinoplanes flavus TaxID=2820290 RepID=A0ABS3USX9_9ACTN|nr:metallophosphoesterase [Actinoplanes flavus]MBO3741688.1 metallophosphoesterase [Actinoplanes flavus]
MTTVVVIGDVGGCSAELARVLEPLVGVPDTVVIQVGDLVDRGPDTPGVLRMVGQRLVEGAPRRIQLLGNHEAPYVGGEPFWPQPLSEPDARLLETWWLTERLRVAAAVRTGGGEDFLVTHAGLSPAVWRDLGEPVTAATAAELLNTRPEPLLWGYGGPLWVEPPELYGGWLAGWMPFSQIHGHSAIVSYEHESWMCEERIRQRSTVDWVARRTQTRVGGGRFIAVDPKHGRTGAVRWSPLVIENAELLV